MTNFSRGSITCSCAIILHGVESVLHYFSYNWLKLNNQLVMITGLASYTSRISPSLIIDREVSKEESNDRWGSLGYQRTVISPRIESGDELMRTRSDLSYMAWLEVTRLCFGAAGGRQAEARVRKVGQNCRNIYIGDRSVFPKYTTTIYTRTQTQTHTSAYIHTHLCVIYICNVCM